MKTSLHTATAALVVLGALLAGCGPSQKEIEERQRVRLEQERAAQQAIQKSNDAVNDVSKKLGRKPPQFDLGLPPEKRDATLTPDPKKP